MRIENISQRTYQHSELDENHRIKILDIKPGENKEIPDNIAEIWLKTGEVRIFVDPAEAKAKEAALKAKNEELEAELKKLKEEKTEKAAKATSKKTTKKNK